MKLARNRLQVRNAPDLADFYCRLLGMRALGSSDTSAFGYNALQCLLEFHEGNGGPYLAKESDCYWKIGITLRNLDSAAVYLREQGWPVSSPRQFRDIGYMCHLRDPEGFAIELLQQGFEGNEAPAGAGHPIGGQATLAHVTLRTNDIAAARQLCERGLGMRLMSVQPVPERGFTLYFYGWSSEALPNPDLEAVQNREWLWARPYTLLELQHLEKAVDLRMSDEGACGFAGFAYGGDASSALTYLSPSELVPLIREIP